MRRLALAALLALALGGCGAAPAPQRPALALGLVGEPLAAAPILLAQDEVPLPLEIRRGAAALTAPYLLAPSSVLPELARQGWVVLGAACATPPDVLLWHEGGLFGWSALDKQSLYVAPGADAGALGAAIARYRGVISPLPEPTAQRGGIAGFEEDPGSFLLAPEPTAADLLVSGRAELAQPLPDELGPYPTCLVLAQAKVLQADPLLSERLLRAMNLGLWRFATESPGQIALALRPLSPATSPAGLLRSVLTARREDVFPTSVTLSAAVTSALVSEFPRGRLSDGALAPGPSLRALRDPFRP